MAEFVMKDLVRRKGLDWEIASAATSREELGHDTHPGTKAKLREMNIPFTPRRARQITQKDYADYDLLIGMDRYNMISMKRFYGEDPQHKLCLLADFTAHPPALAAPSYTGNFDDTFTDVYDGCQGLIEHYTKEENQ